MTRRYRYSKKSGAVQDAMVPAGAEPPIVQSANLSAPLGGALMADEVEMQAMPARGRRSVSTQHRTNVLPPPAPPEPEARHALDPHVNRGRSTMFFHTVEDGQRVLVTDRSGRVQVVTGPRRIWRWGRTIRPMAHYVAHPGEFLIVRFRSGDQEHLPGPSECWFDPRTHLAVEKEESVQIAAKEAVVVYAEHDGAVTQRVVHGPATFVPAPGEWLHTFRWHGASPDAVGFQKVPGALVFQKLWLMPDQMYHDVADVRTADDAVLTIRLMLFFELMDVEKMLSTTHDPIGDFVNAATSDVVDFVGKCSLDEFKARTDALNELDTYPRLIHRSGQCGYRIDNVVYRGYGAPPALQRLQDEATESRVRLQLERATEEQAQQLEDVKLERRLARAAKQREQAGEEQAHRLELAEREQASQRRLAELEHTQHEAQARASQAREREHLEALSGMGVNLTKLLTQRTPDRTIEVRGGAPHLHFDGDES